jgi:ATP-dependent Clp protease ATP-binding subunit ClpB
MLANDDDATARVMEALRANFRPEFLNRIDEVVIFRSLTREQIGSIVDIQLERVRARLRERGMSLSLTQEAREWVAARGYDPTFGARPLKRVIQREILDPLAMKLLSGDIREGETVVVERGPAGLELKGALSAAAVVA